MKKTVALILSIMLLATMFVMTGCTKQTAVVLTVNGFETDMIVPASTQNMRVNFSKVVDPNGIEPAKYTITGLADGDYAMMLVDMNGQSCPFTLKIHNGKIETETPEGVTVNPIIK